MSCWAMRRRGGLGCVLRQRRSGGTLPRRGGRALPVRSGCAQDAPIDDFTRLFAPGGMLDSYYQSQIKPYVDARGPVWRVHALGGVAAPVDAERSRAFNGPLPSATCSSRWAVANRRCGSRSCRLPAAVQKATLTLGARSIATDATRPVTFTWPGADGMASAGLSFGAGDSRARTRGAIRATPREKDCRQPVPGPCSGCSGQGRLQPEGSPRFLCPTFAAGRPAGGVHPAGWLVAQPIRP